MTDQRHHEFPYTTARNLQATQLGLGLDSFNDYQPLTTWTRRKVDVHPIDGRENRAQAGYAPVGAPAMRLQNGLRRLSRIVRLVG